MNGRTASGPLLGRPRHKDAEGKVEPCSPGIRRASLAPGFTLAELLAVIAVIAILAALLLLALGRARAAADAAACQSNLHQIGLGLRLYVDDYLVYPISQWVSPTLGDLVNWKNQCWYDRVGRYAGLKWPQWDTNRNCYTPDASSGVAVCPATTPPRRLRPVFRQLCL